ncbi:hypothetical protein HMPREF0972_01177 [Actinomyces sp. oral taxon 848 str. F0332]|nr:hypothetical protein HMPREF0972_01177 [Actinomyces sp. oral taxon 848 str. F0332]
MKANRHAALPREHTRSRRAGRERHLLANMANRTKKAPRVRKVSLRFA